MKSAKVFMNGRSQAIRLPREFRVSGKQVYLKRVPGGILITEKNPWDVFYEAVAKLSPSAFESPRDQGTFQEREPLT